MKNSANYMYLSIQEYYANYTKHKLAISLTSILPYLTLLLI